jgi:hypothetical protein
MFIELIVIGGMTTEANRGQSHQPSASSPSQISDSFTSGGNSVEDPLSEPAQSTREEARTQIGSTSKMPNDADPSNSRFPISSYWTHNGSIVGLVVEGIRRTIVYVEVRGGLAEFVKPGSVLFSGISNGDKYRGKAFRFWKNLPPIDYEVEGPIMNEGSKVVLIGKAPIRDPGGSVVRYIEDRLDFSLLHPNK